MKKILYGLAAAAVLVIVVGVGTYAWASSSAGAKLSKVYDTHEVDFPVPMPVEREPEAERADEGSPAEEELYAALAGTEDGTQDGALEEGELEEEVDLEALALSQAVERGQHLLRARYACADCHGENMGGGVMVDDPAMGRLLGPNLTQGKGSVVLDYTVADWDRIVRHGIRKDRRPALMPSEDFMAMSDQELSDIIAYIGTLPPVDNEVPPSTLGPIGKMLVATGKFPLSAELIGAHDQPHRLLPPKTEASLEFGEHLARTCTGCHRQNFEGGPIVQGPPDWAPATNLTRHESGLADYDHDSFVRVMREGIRPNGEGVRQPMDAAISFTSRMTDVELEALWMYFDSLTPIPMGK